MPNGQLIGGAVPGRAGHVKTLERPRLADGQGKQGDSNGSSGHPKPLGFDARVL
jgi:hypothetical protein